MLVQLVCAVILQNAKLNNGFESLPSMENVIDEAADLLEAIIAKARTL